MVNFRRFLFPGGLISAILAVAIPFLPHDLPSEGLAAFIGRFHPLIVHFPIVLILIPLAMEGLIFFGKNDSLKTYRPWILALAVVSGLGAVLAGYFLYATGDYEGELVNNHLWGGVGVVILLLVAALLLRQSQDASRQIFFRLYILGLVLANGWLIYTGHLGGSLTHGEDYLSEVFPFFKPTAPIVQKPREELLVYQDIIQPVFEVKCISCHNKNKKKGGLIMSTLEAIQEGGDSEKPLIVPGDPDKSELLARISLPESEDDHMPPAGKPQMTESEMTLLKWWIESGANSEQKLGTLTTGTEIALAVEKLLPEIGKAQVLQLEKKEERDKLRKKIQPIADKYGFVLVPDPDDSLHFSLSMKIPPEKITDNMLAELQPYAEAFSRISLVSAEITDEGLYYLGRMENLKTLILTGTCVKGEGLTWLMDLPNLETLNLSHTDVSDSDVLKLSQMPSLKTVYLLDTKVGENLIFALDTFLQNVEVKAEEGQLY
ncbi:MAG: c-type cytochrome domain-containing protein [Bacteroidia bacterium]|nr:c-type cytochrome domain-containing protein [Bacteroidia bacterium]